MTNGVLYPSPTSTFHRCVSVSGPHLRLDEAAGRTVSACATPLRIVEWSGLLREAEADRGAHEHRRHGDAEGRLHGEPEAERRRNAGQPALMLTTGAELSPTIVHLLDSLHVSEILMH
jgi:hypothetical protein